MFVKTIDGLKFLKRGKKLFEMLNTLVEEIGKENVVKVITDNINNYVFDNKLLEEKRPHLYWILCAAHCIDLMLKTLENFLQ